MIGTTISCGWVLICRGGTSTVGGGGGSHGYLGGARSMRNEKKKLELELAGGY